MVEYTTIPATQEHGRYLSTRLRQADIDEMWAGHRLKPRIGIMVSIAVSRDTSYTGCVDGVPICIFGVAKPSLLVDAGRPWLVGSDEIEKHAMKFLRENRKVLRRMKEEFPFMFNYVDARHENAIVWLDWLGFTIEDEVPYGPGQVPFHRFTMGEEKHV